MRQSLQKHCAAQQNRKTVLHSRKGSVCVLVLMIRQTTCLVFTGTWLLHSNARPTLARHAW